MDSYEIINYISSSVKKTPVRYREALAYPGGDVPVEFLDYDWSLNDYRSSSRR